VTNFGPCLYINTTVKLCSEQEATMKDSRGPLKVSGGSHPRWRQVCTLHQKGLKVKQLSVSYSDTSAKLQYLPIVFDDNTHIAELECNVKIPEVNMSSGNATTRERGGVGAATLAKNWGIRIEAAKRMHLVTTQRG
jgi:hypothetical protein